MKDWTLKLRYLHNPPVKKYRVGVRTRGDHSDMIQNTDWKKAMTLGKNVWEQVSSHQWKGGGIDGRVSPRTGVSEWIALDHHTGTRPGWAGRVTVVLSVWWQEGLRSVFLMKLVRVRFRVLGGNPLHGSDTLGFTDGDYPWNLSLGHHTGDFWVGCGCFFLGGRGRGRGTPGHDCVYVLYYILNSGGFVAECLQTITKGVLDPRCPGQCTCSVQDSTTRRPVPHIEDSEGVAAPRSDTSPQEAVTTFGYIEGSFW
jgi:hypothetical protein